MAATLPRAAAAPVKPWLPFAYNGWTSICYDDACEGYSRALAFQGERRLIHPAGARLLALDPATGQPDLQFRSADAATLDASTGSIVAQLAVRDDESIVVALQSSRDQGVLVGLDANGQPDAGFVRAAGVYRGLVALPDGRVAAYRTDGLGAGEVWRFLRDGRPDASFGAGGRASGAIAIGMLVTGLAADAAGRLLVVGSQARADELGIGGRVAVALRLGIDGAPDSAFGTDGVVTLPFAGFGGEAVEVLPEPDGAAFIVANAAREAGTVGVAVLARLDRAGRIDANFGTAGITWPGSASCTGADYEALSATRITSGGVAIGAGGWTRSAASPPRERTNYSAGAALLGVDARGGADADFGDCGRYRFYEGSPGVRVARVSEHRGDLFATTVYVPESSYLFWDYSAEIWRLSRGRAASPGVLRATGSESNTGFRVGVDRVGGDVARVDLRYSTVDGTATAGRDYQAASGSFTWEDGVIGIRSVNVLKVASACVAAGATPPMLTVRFESATNGVAAPPPVTVAFTKPVCASAATAAPAPAATPLPGGGGGGALDLVLVAVFGGYAAARTARAAQRNSRSAGGSETSG